MRVTMLADVYTDNGALMPRGSTQDVTLQFGQRLVGEGRALDVDGVMSNFGDRLGPVVAGVDTATPGVVFPRGTLVRDATGLICGQADGAGAVLSPLGGDYIDVNLSGAAGGVIGV